MKETKTITATLKQAGEAGEFEAVIATLNTVDKDGDIVMPGALNGKTLTLLPAHESWHVPLGKAKIEERGDLAVAVGKFNLGVRAAQDWHAAVKFDLENPPALQEYSWDLIPTETQEDTVNGSRVRRLFEVDSKEMSLVLRGASVNTRTLSVKSYDVHKTETSDAPFDVVANLRLAKDLASVDSGFLHHFYDTQGKMGAASTRACHRWIAWLNTEGLGLPQEKRLAAYAHLAAHLKDADEQPDTLAAPTDRPSLKLVQQLRLARWDTETVIQRLQQLSEERAKDGRSVGTEAKAELAQLAAESESLAATLESVASAMATAGPDDLVSQAMTKWATGSARRGL